MGVARDGEDLEMVEILSRTEDQTRKQLNLIAPQPHREITGLVDDLSSCDNVLIHILMCIA